MRVSAKIYFSPNHVFRSNASIFYFLHNLTGYRGAIAMSEEKKAKRPGWKDALTQKYAPHKHCIVCGRAVPPEEDFCSTECRDKYTSAEKSKNKKSNVQLFLLIGVFAVFMIVMQFAR